MKKKYLLFINMVLLAFAVSSCKLPDIRGSHAPQEKNNFLPLNTDDVMDQGPVKGGVLKLFCTAPDTLNPIVSNNSYVKEFSGLVFESLVKLDRNQKPLPLLAESWEVSEDGLTWTFHMRKDVYWHDKAPFTADDVQFTIEAISNAGQSSIYRRNIEDIATFAAIDKSTFQMILKRNNSFMAELMTFPIIPKHYYAGEDITVLSSHRNMTPIGTGMYKYAKSEDQNHIRLISNENWWHEKDKEVNGVKLPYIGEINIVIGKSHINAFQANDADMISISRNEISRHSGRSGIQIKKYPSQKYEFVAFNLSKPALQDRAVRQAIAYAIDKSRIINELLPGEAIATDLPVIPDTWLYDTNITAYKPDLEKARSILSENGWKESRGALYKNINGVSTSLNLELIVNTDNDLRFKVAEKISSQLKEIGINIKVTKLNWEDLHKRLNTKKFDLVVLGWDVSSIPDISFAYSSSEIASGRNVPGYSNPDVDNYLSRILSENDANKKKALFMNMKDIINEDVPYIGLFFFNNATLYNKRIKGEMNPYIWDKFGDITGWYIPIR